MSSEDFATRFGHLFNTWVSLGYCPQCTSDVLAGNDTLIHPSLQSSYRQATAIAVVAGNEVRTIHWPWLAVLLVFSTLLLFAGILSVVLESAAPARPAGQNVRRTAMWVGDVERADDSVLELRLPKACSAVFNSQRTTQWAKALMQDMDAAVRDGHASRIYR